MNKLQERAPNLQAATKEQTRLLSFLEEANFPFADDSEAPKTLDEARALLEQKLKLKIGNNAEEPLDADLQKVLLNDPDFIQKALVEGLQYSNDVEGRDNKLIQKFYASEDFEAIYLKAQALKEPGERVQSKDIGELLKNGTAKEQSIFKLLTSSEYEAVSQTAWEKSEFRRKFKESFEKQEKSDIAEFFKDLSVVAPEDQRDVKKLIEAFEKKFPNYKNKVESDWYQKEFKQQIDLLKDPDVKKLNDYYNSDEFKKLYNQVSAEIGKAPEWSNIKAALTKLGKTDILQLVSRNPDASKKFWNETWEDARAEFDRFEKEEFDAFTDKLTAKDFADTNKIAEDFQNTRKRYAGAPRLDWYKQQLAFKKRFKESEWKGQMNDFYQTQLPGIYAQIAREKKGAPEWQDIKTKITDPDLLYLLEDKFKDESEAKWKTYWQNAKENFDSAESNAATEFFKTLSPTELDNLSAVKAKFNNATEFKADNHWFETQLTAFTAEQKAVLETKHQTLVKTLPDNDLASAMHSAFKNASTFAERVKWSEENVNKVSEYSSFINQNNSLEEALTTRAKDHPDLKKDLAKIKSAYKEGKTNYTANFYSPRKYNEALTVLSNQVNERERLTTSTVNFIENKTFSQIPKLTDKKKLTYDEFRDALKKLDFYKLDPAVRKNEKVRSAARGRTKALHAQWLDHRSLHIEQNKKSQVEKSKSVINRVKLPAKLPDNIADYPAFTVALKEKGVYDALPKGVLKNEQVRATAHAQNVLMWDLYQAEQGKTKGSEQEVNLSDDPKLKDAQNHIKGVKLDSALQLKLIAKLAGKDAKDANTFTVALRELQVYGGVDQSVWKNPALREQAWQQNMKLQREFLNKSNSSPDLKTNSAEDKEQNENHGLPGHYKINWDSLDSRLNPDQKKRAIDRFKEMHNRSDIGMQTVMQQFHQPLGTFILETLAVMPKDKYDKAVNALKNVRVEANNREQASDWLKVLCESAGLSFLEKETSAGWSQLKQNFTTYFGKSLNKAWEVETDEVEEVTEMPSDDAELKPDTVEAEKELELIADDEPEIANEHEVTEATVPETETVVETADVEEPLPEIIDEPAPELESVPTSREEIMPDLEGPDLTVNDTALDTVDIEEEANDITVENLTADEPEVEAEVQAEAEVEIETPTEEPVEVEAVVEADEEITEVIDDTSALESDALMADDTEVDDEAAFEEPAEDLDDSETDDEATLETTEEIPDDTEIVEDTTDIEADELLADTEGVEASVDVETEVDDEAALEATEAMDDASLEGEATPEVTPEVIPVVRIENKEREAEVHEALVAWQSFTETNLPTAIKSESDDLKKQFTEILKTGLDEATIAQLKASGNWEKLMASPAHQQLLRTHMKQHEAMGGEDLHFFTALQQELYFSSSVTVNKFLEQLKSYAQFTKEVTATISTPPSDAQITKETAQALFNAFATKFHSTNKISNLSLGYENQQLKVAVNAAQTKSVWHFDAPELQDA